MPAPVLPYPVPVGATARRLDWVHLPPPVRRAVEARIGTTVADWRSCDAGFTPGFASVLVGADGSRHFVKAASARAQPTFAASYRQEALRLGALPAEVPAPRLRWWCEEHDWVVLAIEHVDGVSPARPWTEPQLAACLAALDVVAEVLTPVPDGLDLPDLADDLAGWPGYWATVGARRGLRHADDAAALAAGFAEHVAGSTVVHTDIRDDNALLLPDGSAVFCDWNWLARGAPWVDRLMLLVGPRGDGLDVEAVLATHPAFADLHPDGVDSVLALLAGYCLASADLPVPGNSPHLRDHQRWQGEVAWAWLCERRGWVPD